MSKVSSGNNSKILTSIKLVLPLPIKTRLLELAKENCRSLNSEIVYSILEHIKKNENSGQNLAILIKKFIDSENGKYFKKKRVSKGKK